MPGGKRRRGEGGREGGHAAPRPPHPPPRRAADRALSRRAAGPRERAEHQSHRTAPRRDARRGTARESAAAGRPCGGTVAERLLAWLLARCSRARPRLAARVHAARRCRVSPAAAARRPHSSAWRAHTQHTPTRTREKQHTARARNSTPQARRHLQHTHRLSFIACPRSPSTLGTSHYHQPTNPRRVPSAPPTCQPSQTTTAPHSASHTYRLAPLFIPLLARTHRHTACAG